MTASKRPFRISSNPAMPSQAVCTAYPSCSSWASTRARQPASSSTTNIRFPYPSISPPSLVHGSCPHEQSQQPPNSVEVCRPNMPPLPPIIGYLQDLEMVVHEQEFHLI